MSIVYICETSVERKSLVAVKRLLPAVNATPGAPERFLRECYLWLRLGRHPNIVEALSAHQVEPEPPFVILDYVPDSLREVLTSKSLDLRQCVRVAIAIVDGLIYATTKLPGFVHGDLKPENILLTDDGTAKITDLGLSRTLDVALPTLLQDSEANSSKATSMTIAGTPLYMSPEQVRGQQPEAASDIYALGCILYEMLAHRLPYGNPTSVPDYLLRHLHSVAVPLSAIRGDLPAELSDLVMSCLGKVPTERPGSSELASRLRTVARHLGLSYEAPTAEAPDPARLALVAQGMINLGFTEDARIIAQEALGYDLTLNHRIWAHITIARSYSQEGRNNEADNELQAVEGILDERDTAPAFKVSYFNERGRVEEQKGNHQRAVEYLIEGIKSDPNASITWYNLARIDYEHFGEVDRAIEAMQQAVRISVNLMYVTPLIGWLIEKGRIQEAVEYGELIVEVQPGNAQAHGLRATTRMLGMLAGGSQDDRAIDDAMADLAIAIRRKAPRPMTDNLIKLAGHLGIEMVFPPVEQE
jgi:serine/threonine protein kinase